MGDATRREFLGTAGAAGAALALSPALSWAEPELRAYSATDLLPYDPYFTSLMWSFRGQHLAITAGRGAGQTSRIRAEDAGCGCGTCYLVTVTLHTLPDHTSRFRFQNTGAVEGIEGPWPVTRSWLWMQKGLALPVWRSGAAKLRIYRGAAKDHHAAISVDPRTGEDTAYFWCRTGIRPDHTSQFSYSDTQWT